MTKDIRSPNEPETYPTIGSPGDSMQWAQDLPDKPITPKNIGFPTTSEFQTKEGSSLINPSTGKPFGMETKITRTYDEVQRHWEDKLHLQPCFLCEHWIPNAVSKEEKKRLWDSLSKDHGWTEQAVEGYLNNPEDFEFCEAYNHLSHRNASCPRFFKPRKTLLRISVRS